MSSTPTGAPQRCTRTRADVDADRLEDEARDLDATHVRDCPATTVTGRLRSVPLRAVATAVEAELGDGTGRLTLLVLGPRRIPGITPGRHVIGHGRALVRDGESAMLTRRYQLLPSRTD